MICPGPCNSAYRRAGAAHREEVVRLLAVRARVAEMLCAAGLPAPALPMYAMPDRVPAGRSVPGEPHWCRRCVGLVRRYLVELDDLAALLEVDADGHRGKPAELRVSGSPSAGGPAPSPRRQVLDALYVEMASWEDAWREAQHYAHRPHRGRGAGALSTVVAWLASHADEMLTAASGESGQEPGAVRYGRRVLSWHRLLERMVRADPPVRRRPGVCPRCDRRGLRRRDDGYTQCAGCGRLLSELEYAGLIGELVGEEAR